MDYVESSPMCLRRHLLVSRLLAVWILVSPNLIHTVLHRLDLPRSNHAAPAWGVGASASTARVRVWCNRHATVGLVAIGTDWIFRNAIHPINGTTSTNTGSSQECSQSTCEIHDSLLGWLLLNY